MIARPTRAGMTATDPSKDQRLSRQLAATTAFARLLHTASCASTQDLAAADPGDDEAVFWADHQTAGRGRQQRPWFDRPGCDLALTFRLRRTLPSPMALPMAVPLAIHDAVATRLGAAAARLRVKWPNDVLVGDRKLAGVLIDAQGGPAQRLLIGVGLNVNAEAPPAEVAALATSLRQLTGAEHDRHELVLDLATSLDRALADLAEGAEAATALAARYTARLGLLGRRVVIEAPEVTTGVLRGIDPGGVHLDGERTFALGQVRALRAE